LTFVLSSGSSGPGGGAGGAGGPADRLSQKPAVTPAAGVRLREPPFMKQSIDEYVSEKCWHQPRAAHSAQHSAMVATFT